MSKKLSKSTDTGGGYKMPPVATRFSSENQPKRVPRKLDRVSAVELGKKKIPIVMGGSAIRMEVDEVIARKQIEQALEGKIPAARDLYERLYREEAVAKVRPRRMSARRKAKLLEDLRVMLALPAKWDRQLREVGLIEVVEGKERQISPWVQTAYAVRSRNEGKR